jgi:plastocyanin
VKIRALIVTAPLVDTIGVGPGIAFSPTSVALKAGGVVTFKWADGPHGIHFTSGPAPLPANSANMSSGTVDYTLNNAGTYGYDCTVHGNLMTGTIIVQP